VRAIGPLPEPDIAPLEASIAAAGLGSEPVVIELVPSRIVNLGEREAP
jgi:hypothetical protein